MYNATAPLFRRVVFHVDRAECMALATRGTELVMKYGEQYLGDTEFGYEYFAGRLYRDRAGVRR